MSAAESTTLRPISRLFSYEDRNRLDPSTFFGMIDKVIAKYPQVKVVATTLREVHSTNHHSWSAVAWIDGKTYSAPTCELDVLDRVRGGDGFASGFLYGLLTGGNAGRSGEARLGAWGVTDDVPRRHDDGDRRTGACICKRGIGEDTTVNV